MSNTNIPKLLTPLEAANMLGISVDDILKKSFEENSPQVTIVDNGMYYTLKQIRAHLETDISEHSSSFKKIEEKISGLVESIKGIMKKPDIEVKGKNKLIDEEEKKIISSNTQNLRAVRNKKEKNMTGRLIKDIKEEYERKHFNWNGKNVELVTSKDAAKILNFSEPTMQQRRSKKMRPAFIPIKNNFFYKKHELEQYLKEKNKAEKDSINGTELSKKLGVSNATLVYWRSNNKGPEFHEFEGRYLYKKSDAEKFMKDHNYS